MMKSNVCVRRSAESGLERLAACTRQVCECPSSLRREAAGARSSSAGGKREGSQAFHPCRVGRKKNQAVRHGLAQTSATFRKSNHVGRVEMGGLHHAQAFDIRLLLMAATVVECPPVWAPCRSPEPVPRTGLPTRPSAAACRPSVQDGSGAVA